jgi:hypothetical protein
LAALIWCFLAFPPIGAIVTTAIVNEEGNWIVAAESGELLFWDLHTKGMGQPFCI